MLKSVNLQLFAEEGEVANPENTETPVQEIDVDSNVEKDGDQQPEINDETPIEQSKDKTHPANSAFARYRRENKELKEKYQMTQKQIEEMNNAFKELAKQNGVDGIEDVQGYLKAVKRQTLQQKYKQSQDPIVLAELVADMVKQDTDPQKQQEEIVNNAVEEQLQKELKEFNEEFGKNLENIDDVISLPNSDKIIDYMEKRNLSITDAYFLANRADIQKEQSEKAKQEAINQARGFSHVKPNSQGGEVNANAITQEEIKSNLPMWRAMFPNASQQEIVKMMQKAKDDGDL